MRFVARTPMFMYLNMTSKHQAVHVYNDRNMLSTLNQHNRLQTDIVSIQSPCLSRVRVDPEYVSI